MHIALDREKRQGIWLVNGRETIRSYQGIWFGIDKIFGHVWVSGSWRRTDRLWKDGCHSWVFRHGREFGFGWVAFCSRHFSFYFWNDEKNCDGPLVKVILNVRKQFSSILS